MGKKNKGRKQVVVTSAGDLDSFTNPQASDKSKDGQAAGQGAQVSSSDTVSTVSSETMLKDWLKKVKEDPERQSVKDFADCYL